VTSEPRRERKVVTALFCDLVGFTSRAESMDPEDVEAMLRPYHARVRSELERHGGTVEKFIGDAVMALFGAPTAHEDDPERAVRAALAIRESATDEGIELRVGIATGEALVTVGARPDAGETMATGDVVNTASRLQAAAPVNGILVGERTFEATKQAIEYREAEPIEAKGKAQPVPVREALHARARVELERAHGASLVGRRRELDLLADALARARQERAPQLVTLVGVPGIGKSRLVLELFNLVEADTELIRWRHGRCLPYGDGVTFWALGEMVKAEAGVLETDSADETEAKLERAVEDEWVRSHLRPLLGLATDTELTEDRRSEAFAAWRSFFEGLAEQGPLVLVFEDLHWGDESLRDFVDHLVDWASGVPLLVVCTARPELLERRPGWGGGKPNALTLSLSPLSDEETAKLIAELLERPVLEAEAQSLLLARAEGNPLYAEQYVRMLRERGDAEDLPLPETVQGIIAARIDGLDVEAKGLLQDASVLGKVFVLGGVALVSGLELGAIDQLLHGLERKEFVRRERRAKLAEETEYSFRHLLVRDVAYGQIPRGERAEKHRLVAEWIESLGRPDDHAEVLAHHYLQALDLVTAAGGDVESLAERARTALRDAGDRALGLNALPPASRLYERALELWPKADPERPQLLFRLGSSLRNTERGAAVLEEASDALLAVGDRESVAEAQAMLATLAWHDGDRDRCDDHLRRAASLLEEEGPSRAKAYVLSQISRYRMLANDMEEAIRIGQEALSMGDELRLNDIRASALNQIGTSRVLLGDPQNGIGDLERSIAIALDANSVECCRGYTNLAACLWYLGYLDRTWEVAAEGRRAARSFGDEVGLRFLEGHLIGQLYLEGRWDDCLRAVDEFLALSESGSPHYLDGECRLDRARVRFARGETDGALADARMGLEEARRSADPQTLVPTQSGYVRILCELGRVDEAAQLANELLQRVEDTAGSNETGLEMGLVAARLGIEKRLRTHVERAPLQTRWNEAARALLGRNYVEAAETFAEIGDLPDEAHSRLLAAEALMAEGRRAEADEQLQKALAFYRSVGATFYINRGEQLLAKSA
jgi:class 3 adenylate cyclase/predicted ATPase